MNSLVPKLRFKEFKGSWEIKPLIQLSVNGFSNGAFNDPKKVGSGYRIINVKDMYINGTINIDTLTRVALDENEFSKNRVEYGDIFFTRSSIVKEGIAYSNVNLNNVDDLTYDGHLIRMRPDKSNHSPIFLYYNFSTSTARKEFVKRGKTATMTTIGQEDISKVNIVFPSLPEQQKIASFLSEVDEKIQQLTRKKELLEQYKKGVMQQLFSGKLRFKDENGKAFPKWEESRLGNLCTITTGKLDANAMKEDGRYRFYTCAKEYYQIDSFSFDTEALLISGNGANVGYIHHYKGKFNAYQRTYVLDGFTQDIIYIKKFLERFLHQRIHVEKKDGNTPYITMGTLTEMMVSIPSLQEQQKIASFLSTLDVKIESVASQISHTQTFKKALLQQMFV